MERLVVTSSQLKSISDQFKTVANQVKRTTDDMMTTVNSINNVWEGDAASAYKTQFGKLQEDMDQMYKMIMEYDKDLDEIAQKYNEAEKANAQLAQSLPTDAVTY